MKFLKNNRKYIVAGIYRHPDRDIGDFSVQLDKILENISKKKIPCIIAGDINIDFVKYDAHRETTDYVTNLLVNNFIPMIIMPSRVTANSATIIDHIYYYEGSNSKKNQNMFTGNLSDHLPNYLLITDKHSKADAKRPK